MSVPERIRAMEPAQETLRRQLQDEPSHGPTSARYPAPRGIPVLPMPEPAAEGSSRATAPPAPASREYESHDWYEEFLFTIPAGTAFVEAGRFSGIPDSLLVRTNLSSVDVRLRRDAGPAGDAIRIRVAEPTELLFGARIVEARDPAGVGGQAIFVQARFASKQIAIRQLQAPEPTPTP